jgi:dsRNA-specific ribonuclease
VKGADGVGEAKVVVERMLSAAYLSMIGRYSKDGESIESMVRPSAPLPLPPSRRRNMSEHLRHSAQGVGHDPDTQIARAVKAIIGAVYFDGGFEAARGVMAQLMLAIQAA